MVLDLKFCHPHNSQDFFAWTQYSYATISFRCIEGWY